MYEYEYGYVCFTTYTQNMLFTLLLLTTGQNPMPSLYYMRTYLFYLSMRQRYWSDSHICMFRNSFMELGVRYICVWSFVSIHSMWMYMYNVFSGTLTHFHYNIFESMRYGQKCDATQTKASMYKKRWVDSCRVVCTMCVFSITLCSAYTFSLHLQRWYAAYMCLCLCMYMFDPILY